MSDRALPRDAVASLIRGLKRRGVTLERAMKGVPFPELAGAVYHSDRPEPEFRRDLLLDCLSAHPGFR